MQISFGRRDRLEFCPFLSNFTPPVRVVCLFPNGALKVTTNLEAYLQNKNLVIKHEKDGDTKKCDHHRVYAISYWNKLTPKEQKEVAERFLPKPEPEFIYATSRSADPKRYADLPSVLRD
jgi:hypothetical protein